MPDSSVSIDESEDTGVSVSFDCPTCNSSMKKSLSKPYDRDARFGCSECKKAHYLFPVVSPMGSSLNEMTIEEQIAYQLESIRITEETGRANDSMVTQSIKLVFTSISGFTTAFFAGLGFLLMSVERSLLPQVPFWMTFSLLGVGLSLGVVSLVFGPPAYLKELYDYIQTDDNFEGLGHALRVIGNYHHVHPFLSERVSDILFSS